MDPWIKHKPPKAQHTYPLGHQRASREHVARSLQGFTLTVTHAPPVVDYFLATLHTILHPKGLDEDQRAPWIRSMLDMDQGPSTSLFLRWMCRENVTDRPYLLFGNVFNSGIEPWTPGLVKSHLTPNALTHSATKELAESMWLSEGFYSHCYSIVTLQLR